MEKWEIRLFKNLLPDLFKVVQDINLKLVNELCVQDRFKKREYRNGASVMETDWQRIREYEVFDERKGLVYMAKIACYMADVLSAEPAKADNPLLAARNTMITPHVAWAPLQTRARLLDVAVENVRNFIKGSPRNVVSGL